MTEHDIPEGGDKQGWRTHETKEAFLRRFNERSNDGIVSFSVFHTRAGCALSKWGGKLRRGAGPLLWRLRTMALCRRAGVRVLPTWRPRPAPAPLLRTPATHPGGRDCARDCSESRLLDSEGPGPGPPRRHCCAALARRGRASSKGRAAAGLWPVMSLYGRPHWHRGRRLGTRARHDAHPCSDRVRGPAPCSTE